MTQELGNLSLSPEAQQRLESYLDQIRASLAGCRSVDPDEVIRDVLDHVEQDLAAADSPVTAPALDAVLARLGSPTQWVPIEDLSPWRRLLVRLRFGPEDWRLAYASIGVLILGFPLLGPFAVIGGFLLARAALAAVPNPDDLGVRRWLVYPALLMVYVPVVLLVLIMPAVGAGAAAFGLMESRIVLGDFFWSSVRSEDPYRIAAVIGIIGAAGTAGAAIWWSLLRLVAGRWPGLLDTGLAPFGRHIQPKWLTWLTFFALALTAILLIALKVIWPAATAH